MSKMSEVQNGLSIPVYLRKYPNILELWIKSPDNPPFYISPTFLCRWTPENVRGRVKDRGHDRAIWKVGSSMEECLESIDAEMGLDWPDWKYDKKSDARRYAERKDIYHKTGKKR